MGSCCQAGLSLGFLLALVSLGCGLGVIGLVWLGWLTFGVLAGPGFFGLWSGWSLGSCSRVIRPFWFLLALVCLGSVVWVVSGLISVIWLVDV